MSQARFKTIAAIATPPGYGGIGIVRVSGEQALSFARQLLKQGPTLQFIPNRTFHHRLVNFTDGQVLDEALVTYFQAPHSFTGEDVIEFACHGSPVVLAELLRLLVSLGADLAQPGEFTMRAFLNRRLDLAQAEAINDLIHSQTAYQAQVAARQLGGELAKQLQPLKSALIELIVWFESSVEFVEDDLDALDLERFRLRIATLQNQIGQLASTYRFGKILRAGVTLALIGLPNVGKSSLFNALLGADRAIVTHLPGTTRDTLTEALSINGIPVKLVDTAGLRETTDLIEQLGVERTRTAIVEADLIFAVLSSENSLSVAELELLQTFPVRLCILNKTDLGYTWSPENLATLATFAPVLEVSAKTGAGLAALKQAIYQLLNAPSPTRTEDAIITNERHYAALAQATAFLDQAAVSLAQGFTEEIALAHLHQALQQFGVITGETLIDDILNQIFSTFCIGK